MVGGDESIELGQASQYLQNLWEIEMLSYDQQQADHLPDPEPKLPPVHCHELLTKNSCENATRAQLLTMTGACQHVIFIVIFHPIVSQTSDNIVTTLQIPGRDIKCKWSTTDSKCITLPVEASGAQVTDIVEVGLFGFPAFSEANASSDGGNCFSILSPVLSR
jgi:hypothetical protein